MRIMIIGNLNGQLGSATKMAAASGARVFCAADIMSAISTICKGKSFELIMASDDVQIDDLMYRMKMQRITIPVIACGVSDNPQNAVRAIESGALDYFLLPPNEELLAKVLENLTKKELKYSIVYQSNIMSDVISIASRVAASDANVLITGASGTGKEAMAQFIHDNSKRRHNDMIAVNCASIPENLLESEMFGHEKGAFTGASERRIGKLEEASESTILLDEVSEMDVRLQAKLLRAIQEREIVRIGSNMPIKLNIRFVATSNKDLQGAIDNGSFREDLFYRLNVINIHLPSLKERVDDISILSEHFLKKYSDINGIRIKKISDDAMRYMEDYKWPGNVRELENCIHRALLISLHDEIKISDLMISEKRHNDRIETLANMEKNAILRAMNVYGKESGRAAAALGVSIKLLRQKIKQYELEM